MKRLKMENVERLNNFYNQIEDVFIKNNLLKEKGYFKVDSDLEFSHQLYLSGLLQLINDWVNSDSSVDKEIVEILKNMITFIQRDSDIVSIRSYIDTMVNICMRINNNNIDQEFYQTIQHLCMFIEQNNLFEITKEDSPKLLIDKCYNLSDTIMNSDSLGDFIDIINKLKSFIHRDDETHKKCEEITRHFNTNKTNSDCEHMTDQMKNIVDLVKTIASMNIICLPEKITEDILLDECILNANLIRNQYNCNNVISILDKLKVTSEADSRIVHKINTLLSMLNISTNKNKYNAQDRKILRDVDKKIKQIKQLMDKLPVAERELNTIENVMFICEDILNRGSKTNFFKSERYVSNSEIRSLLKFILISLDRMTLRSTEVYSLIKQTRAYIHTENTQSRLSYINFSIEILIGRNKDMFKLFEQPKGRMRTMNSLARISCLSVDVVRSNKNDFEQLLRYIREGDKLTRKLNGQSKIYYTNLLPNLDALLKHIENVEELWNELIGDTNDINNYDITTVFSIFRGRLVELTGIPFESFNQDKIKKCISILETFNPRIGLDYLCDSLKDILEKYLKYKASINIRNAQLELLKDLRTIHTSDSIEQLSYMINTLTNDELVSKYAIIQSKVYDEFRKYEEEFNTDIGFTHLKKFVYYITKYIKMNYMSSSIMEYEFRCYHQPNSISSVKDLTDIIIKRIVMIFENIAKTKYESVEIQKMYFYLINNFENTDLIKQLRNVLFVKYHLHSSLGNKFPKLFIGVNDIKGVKGDSALSQTTHVSRAEKSNKLHVRRLKEICRVKDDITNRKLLDLKKEPMQYTNSIADEILYGKKDYNIQERYNQALEELKTFIKTKVSLISLATLVRGADISYEIVNQYKDQIILEPNMAEFNMLYNKYMSYKNVIEDLK